MKPVSEWVDNWSASAPRATTAYTTGVQSTTKDWANLTVAAIPNMVAGFNAAANSGAIAAGIRNSGTGYWQSQTVAKAGNFSSGLSTGKDNYAAAAAKLGQAIQSGVSGLNARGPVGSEQNYGRSRALGIYLHDRKGQLGAR
jgi:hypothetical protein